jgi:hypothetical protein
MAAPASFNDAYLDGLMTFRRMSPPPVVDADHGDDGALHGAALTALDATITEPGLAAWARTRTGEGRRRAPPAAAPSLPPE